MCVTCIQNEHKTITKFINTTASMSDIRNAVHTGLSYHCTQWYIQQSW